VWSPFRLQFRVTGAGLSTKPYGALEGKEMNLIVNTILAYQLEILAAVITLLLLLNLILFLAIRRITGRVRQLMQLLRVTDRGSLDEFIKSVQSEIGSIQGQLHDISRWQQKTDEILARCIRTPVITRYRAFEGIGGDQSFSCAFLDGKGDGVVLTSLYSPTSSHSYGKPVKKGGSKYVLSEEEQQVVEQALRPHLSAGE